MSEADLNEFGVNARRASDVRVDDAVQLVLNRLAASKSLAVAGTGLMLLDDESVPRAFGSTDEASGVLDDAQEVLGYGPCIDGITRDTVVQTSDLASDQRWPVLGEIVARHEIHRMMGVPVHAAGVPIGTMNVYCRYRGDWSEDEIAAVTAYAVVIESVIATALTSADRSLLTKQLQTVLERREVIERAIRALIARDDTDAVTAFNTLRAEARKEEAKVVVIAQRMLDAAQDASA